MLIFKQGQANATRKKKKKRENNKDVTLKSRNISIILWMTDVFYKTQNSPDKTY